MRARGLLAVVLVAVQAVVAAEPRYEVASGWPALPEGKRLGQCVGVGVDSRSDVFVFHRNERTWSSPFPEAPIAGSTVTAISGATGKIVAEWGGGEFIMPHGLTIDAEDDVWLTDVGRHQVFKYTKGGRLLLALGERGRPGSDAGHFNQPTDVAVLADGSFYVSDGYRNTRVVKFDAAGKYELEWGGKGVGPGELNLPHGVALDATGRVYVCDRSNARLQVFDAGGRFLHAWSGPEIGRPYGVAVAKGGHIFVADGGDQTKPELDHSKVAMLDAGGKVVASFGSWGRAPGQFQLAHDIAVADDGAVYVAEAKGARVQKFVKR